MNLISGGMIGKPNCIGTSFNGLIQEIKPKGKKNSLKKNCINKNDICPNAQVM